MESPLSFKGIGGLTKPVTKLIEVLAAGTGRIYEPTHVVKMAKAEAEAQLIRAESEAIAESVRDRAKRRQEFAEDRRQLNIEEIAQRSISHLPPTVSSDPIDPDWIFAFVEESKDTSNTELQELWAKILANEITQPGRCSKRTLRIVKAMERSDAVAFSRLASYVFGSGDMVPFVLLPERGLQSWGVSMQNLHELNELRLIIEGPLRQTIGVLRNSGVTYFGKSFQMVLKDPKAERVNVPFLPLTTCGQELLSICHAVPDPQYLAVIKQELDSRHGVMLVEKLVVTLSPTEPKVGESLTGTEK